MIQLDLYHKEMIDLISDGLMVVGKDGYILMANDHMQKLTGFSKKELVGSPCTILNCDVCEIARKNSKKAWCKLFEGGKSGGKPCVITKRNGVYVHAIKKAALLKDSKGEPICAVETFTDISELTLKDLQIQQMAKLLDEGQGFFGMVGQSAIMKRTFDLIEKAAVCDASVIILGESGTGKELAAHAIHQLSQRKTAPFVQFNCAALNESLVESELFGHKRGAFTGAYLHRKGRFEEADGGDIFLDEIGDLPLSTQIKLLRVLETKQFERVGENRHISVDVRIITATNRNIKELIEQGRFREDLYFRINVVPIHLPPLRERKEDIPLLIELFMRRLREKTGKQISGLHSGVMASLMKYDWPGNVRELKSVLEYAFVIAEAGPIETGHLPASFQAISNTHPYVSPIHYKLLVEDESGEKKALIQALDKAGGNKTAAAKILKVNRMTVWNRMRKHGLQLEKRIAEEK